MLVICLGRRSTFGRIHLHFAWQVQHFRHVVLRVFCEWHWLRGVATRCKFRGSRGILCYVLCDEIWRKPRTKHRFLDSKFSGYFENSWKMSIFNLPTIKIDGCLARNARFEPPTGIVFSLWFSSGFTVCIMGHKQAWQETPEGGQQ